VRPSVGGSGKASPQNDKKCMNFAQGLRFSQDLFEQIQEITKKTMKHLRNSGSELLIQSLRAFRRTNQEDCQHT